METMSQFLTKEDLYKARSERLEVELSALQEENKKLREALEYYASEENWCTEESTEEEIVIYDDLSHVGIVQYGGKRARKALETK